MKKIVHSVVALAAIGNLAFAGGDIVPVPVVIEEESVSAFYIGLGIAAVSTRGSDVDFNIFDEETGQDRLGNVTFFVEYDFNEYIAVEGRYTTSFSQEDSVEMDAWSIFAKPQYPVTEEFTVYALLGFGGVTMDSVKNAYLVDVDETGFQWGLGFGGVTMDSVKNAYIVDVDVDETGFQWGLGLSYDVTENITLFGDYTSLANGMDGIYWDGEFETDSDAFTLGATYKF